MRLYRTEQRQLWFEEKIASNKAEELSRVAFEGQSEEEDEGACQGIYQEPLTGSVLVEQKLQGERAARHKQDRWHLL